MIASNRLFAACLLLASAAFSTGPAAAQGQPQAPAPAPAAGAADGAAPPPPPPDPHAVAVDTLDAPRPDSMGLVGLSGGGFSDTLWQGTPAATAQTLVSALPHRYAVPAARRLALKFLLSAAPVEGGANASTMLEARILALAGMGDWDDALALMDFVPAQSRSPMLVKARVTGFLVKGRIDAACGEARTEDTDATWAKLQVLCQFASGQNSAVGVSLGLMREQGLDDKDFLWAADIAQGSTSAPPADLARAAANGTIDPVVMAMLRQAGYLLPKAVVAAADPTTLLFAAQTAMVPPKAPEPEPEPAPVKGAKGKTKKAVKPVKPVDTDELRLFTLERAAEFGVIDAEALRNVYATIALNNDDGVGASADSISIDTARQRAATYQLAITQSVTGSRAEVIARVLDLTRLKPADAVPGPVLTAQIYAPAVTALPVSTDLLWFAPTAVRILAAADGAAPTPVATSSANPWVDLLQSQAFNTSSDPAKSYPSIWPYARLTRSGLAPITPDESAAWQKTLPPDRAGVLRSVAFALLTAVGDGLPASDLQAAIAAETAGDSVVSSATPSTLLWNAIAQSERSGRIGEVTALSLRFLGADGGQPAPIAVTKALESLTATGRSADARAIAVELALDRGL